MTRRGIRLTLWVRAAVALVALACVCLTPGGNQAVSSLTEDQVATLSSLKRLSPHPLYAMTYVGSYEAALRRSALGRRAAATPWACSLFAALDGPALLYGRNFDWDDCPALLLFTRPPDGYASVSLVDMAFLYPDGAPTLRQLEEATLAHRAPLLASPAIPFDGMNECGLVVGMAAVPSAAPPYDAAKRDVSSISAIREMLDHAATVDEALDVLDGINVHMEGGPPIHYLVADRTGGAVLIELHAGHRVALANEGPWHAATNFLVGPLGGNTAGFCWRYDRLVTRLRAARGILTAEDAMALLREVSQPSTQWSAVYDMAAGTVRVAMGRNYEVTSTFFVTGDRLPSP